VLADTIISKSQLYLLFCARRNEPEYFQQLHEVYEIVFKIYIKDMQSSAAPTTKNKADAHFNAVTVKMIDEIVAASEVEGYERNVDAIEAIYHYLKNGEIDKLELKYKNSESIKAYYRICVSLKKAGLQLDLLNAYKMPSILKNTAKLDVEMESLQANGTLNEETATALLDSHELSADLNSVKLDKANKSTLGTNRHGLLAAKKGKGKDGKVSSKKKLGK
jgi:hypothetical protein